MGYKKHKKLILRRKKLIKVMFDIEKKDSFCIIFLFLWDLKEMFLKFEEKNSRFQKKILLLENVLNFCQNLLDKALI